MEGEWTDNPEDLFLNLVVNMFCPVSSDWPTWSFFISESFIFCYQEFILNINECMCGRQNDKIWGRVGVCVCITPHTPPPSLMATGRFFWRIEDCLLMKLSYNSLPPLWSSSTDLLLTSFLPPQEKTRRWNLFFSYLWFYYWVVVRASFVSFPLKCLNCYGWVTV